MEKAPIRFTGGRLWRWEIGDEQMLGPLLRVLAVFQLAGAADTTLAESWAVAQTHRRASFPMS